MARYTGADCRLCRREGAKLFLKGDRCYTDKCAIERRNYAPGEAGKKRIKESEYQMCIRDRSMRAALRLMRLSTASRPIFFLSLIHI